MKVRKRIQNLGPEKSSLAADNEAKNEPKSSGDDIPKNSGFIVGNPESKQVDSTIKVTEGSNTFDTAQKNPDDENITQNAKEPGGSGTKRSISEI